MISLRRFRVLTLLGSGLLTSIACSLIVQPYFAWEVLTGGSPNATEQPRVPMPPGETPNGSYDLPPLTLSREIPGIWSLVVYSPDGSLLAGPGGQSIVRVVESATGHLVTEISIPPWDVIGTTALAFSPDGSQLAVGGLEERVDVFNPTDGGMIRSIDTYEFFSHGTVPRAILYSADGSRLLIASGQDWAGLAVWQFEPSLSRQLLAIPVTDAVLLNDMRTIALSTLPHSVPTETESTIVIFDTETERLKPLSTRGAYSSTVAVNPVGSQVAAIVDGQLTVIDLPTGSILPVDTALLPSVTTDAVFMSNGLLAVLCSNDIHPEEVLFGPFYEESARYTLAVWDPVANLWLASYQLVGAATISSSPTDPEIAVAGLDGILRTFQVPRE